MKLWNDAQIDVFEERFAEAMRECGVLWLVFSLLDRLVDEKLSLPWIGWNLFVSVALWFIGTYIEARAKQP